MSAIISDIRDDLRNLNEVKTEIAKVKAELKGLNVKIDPEAIKILEQRLQSLEEQAARTREKVSESISDMIQKFQSKMDAISLPDIDDSGIQNIKQSAENLSKVYDNLSESAEKSRKKLSSFDDDHLDELKEELENYRDLAEQSVNAATAAYEKQGEYVEALVGQMSKLNEEYTEQLKNGEDTSENVKRFEKLAEELDKAEAKYGELGEKLKEAEGNANDAGKALSNFGKATNIGTIALRAFKGALMSIGWGLATAAIGFVVNKLYELAEAFFAESEEAKKAREEEEKYINEINAQRERMSETVAKTTGKQRSSYESLRKKWNELGDDLKAKEKFVKDNQTAFHNLGFAVNSVTDAENLLVNNTAAVVQAIRLRARAMAIEKAMQEEFEKQETKTKLYKLSPSKTDKNGTGFYNVGDQSLKGNITEEELEIAKKHGNVFKTYKGYIFANEKKQKQAILLVRQIKANQEDRKNIEKSEARVKHLEGRLEEIIDEEKKNAKENNIKLFDGKTPKTTTNKKDPKTERLVESQEKMQEIRSKQQVEQERAARDLWFSTREAEIKAMDESTEKVLAQMELDRQKELEQIERGYEDLRMKRVEEAKKLWDEDPKKKGNNFYESAEFEAANKNTDAETANRDARKNAAEKEFARRERELRNGQIQAMRDYLKEYGSLEQQKYAITKEYDDKIAKESDASQKALLQKQKEHLLAELDMKQLQQSIDWEMVFDDLDRASTEALGGLRDKLRTMLNGGDVNPENAKVLSEKILEIEDEIARRSNVLTSWIPGLKERERLTREVARAEEDAANAAERVFKANNEVFLAQNAAKDAIKNATGKEVAIKDLGNVEFIEKLRNKLDLTTTAGKAADEALANLAVAAGNAAEAQQQYQQAQKDAAARQDALKNFMKGGSVGQYVKDVTAGMDFTQIANLVNTNVQSMSDLVDNIGLGNTEFGEAVHSFADGVGGFNSAIQSLASGDVFGAANGIIEGFQGFGHMIETIGGFSFSGSNEREVIATTERLTKANVVLADRVSLLTDEIGSSAGLKAITASEAALKAQKEIQANNLTVLKAQMGYHSAHHSNAYYADDGEIRRLYNSAKSRLMNIDSNFAKFKVNKLEDIYKIIEADPAYLKTIKEYAPDLWQYLTTVGKYDKSEYWEKAVAEAGKVEEITEKITNNLTQTSFDSLRDSYLDTLTDMESSSEDFAKSFEDMMFKAMINSFVLDDQFDTWLKGWQNRYADAVKNLDYTAIDDLNKEALEMRDQKIVLRNQVASAMGYSTKAEYDDQSASRVSADKITYEQENEHIGILRALQISVEQIRGKMDGFGEDNFLAVTAENLRSINVDIMDIAGETRDLVVSTYLEVREINEHQAKIERAVVDMQPRVAEIERGIKEMA